MKKFFVFLTILSLTLNPINKIQANEELNYDPSKFTDEEIAIIEEMQNTPGCDLSEGEIISVNQENYVFYETNGLTRGAIGSSNMTITIVITKITNSGYDNFKFTAKADWLIAPIVRMQDAFALAWSDNFSLYNYSCSAYYNTVGYLSGKTNLISAPPETGIGYSVECSDWYGQALDYVVLNAYVKKPDDGTKQSANVEAKYGHATVALGVGFTITFDGKGGIGLTTTGAHDEAAASKYFEY